MRETTGCKLSVLDRQMRTKHYKKFIIKEELIDSMTDGGDVGSPAIPLDV
jgi:hypothetical protein